jgi:HD-like signal output (HDOD) protein
MTLAPVKNVTLPASLSIPSIPKILQRMNAMLEDPNCGVSEIAQVVGEDAPIAAKVLKIANSSYYGLRERCLSTQGASAVLGLRVLKNVVTQASVIKQYEHLGQMGFDINGLWKSSIVTAQACSLAARRASRPFDLKPDEFYTCGLLQDLGQFVLLDSLKQGYVEMTVHAKGEHRPIHVIEQLALGYNHTDVGHQVAVRWGLPPAVAAAIGYHHGPSNVVQEQPVLLLAARMNMLVQRIAEGNLAGGVSVFDPSTLRSLGLEQDDLEEIVTFVQEALKSTEV